MAVREIVGGEVRYRTYDLLPLCDRNALLSNGHIACLPTVELVDRWKIDPTVSEIAIPRAWVMATNVAADWRDREPASKEEAIP